MEVIEAYALFLGSLILVGGSLGDQVGRKRTFLAFQEALRSSVPRSKAPIVAAP